MYVCMYFNLISKLILSISFGCMGLVIELCSVFEWARLLVASYLELGDSCSVRSFGVLVSSFGAVAISSITPFELPFFLLQVPRALLLSEMSIK